MVKLGIGLVVALIIIVLLIALAPFTIIGAGQRGVVFNKGTGVEETVLSEGFHFRVPILQNIIKMNVRVQKDEVDSAAGTKDLQEVQMKVVTNYHLDPEKVHILYQEVGKDYLEKVIIPAVHESVKSATANFNAEELLTKRPKVKAQIKESLAKRLATFNIVLDDMSLVNIGFSAEFDKAIEAKQVAEQDAKKAVFLAQKAKNEAEARINQAKGESTAQKLLAASITKDVIQLKEIEAQLKGISKWDGKLPTYMGTDLPFIFQGK